MQTTPTTHPNPQSVDPQDALREYGCLTDIQLSSITGGQVNTIRKRMVQLEKSGQIKRFNRRKGGAGRPTKVSCLPDAKWETSLTREHQIIFNDVRLAFHRAWGSHPELKVRTWDTQSVMLEEGKRSQSTGSYVRPDGIVLFQHPKTTHPLLVFLEIDLGTEPLSRSNARSSSWGQKAMLYRDVHMLKAWCDWTVQQASLNKGVACRLGIISNGARRLAGITQVFERQPAALALWMTTLDQICSGELRNGHAMPSVRDRIWSCLDGQRDRHLIE